MIRMTEATEAEIERQTASDVRPSYDFMLVSRIAEGYLREAREAKSAPDRRVAMARVAAVAIEYLNASGRK